MIGDYLKTPDGMTMAQYGSEDEYVYIQKVSLKLPLIEKFNESDYACKIIGVLETDPEDDQLATEVVIAMDGDFITPEHISLVGYMEQLQKSKGKAKNNGKVIFKSVLEAMLDLRRCLPPILNISAKNFMVHPQTGDARIVLSEDMFKAQINLQGQEREGLLYKSPEELLGEGKSLTTPFWVLGCLLYEAQYGVNPFKTHLKIQVTEMFIKFYPVMFPED